MNYESKNHLESYQEFYTWYITDNQDAEENAPSDPDDAHKYWMYMAWLAGRKSVLQDVEDLQKENKALLIANMDLSNWFNALKTDYDGLVKENNGLKESAKLAIDALNMAKTYVAGEGFDDEIDQVYDATEALEKVLKD